MGFAIKAENISKLYRLGQVGTGTITQDLNRFWAKIRGKEDPYLKIGEDNDRTKKGGSDFVWALRDINFEIEEGEVVGIIGRNGAGKSTLLKLLSRLTPPTTGRFLINGRIASLLEVGTGFNPEMTGRENIYLNGAILGMTRKEINRKFDEIVDFSGVERYIDTPVKRYSSGMYVRLAFAVAAHLESEILIIDEVLAVGDAEFQKKCLGKMGDVSKKEGRTVLFVSHNMDAVQSLCGRGIYLRNGKIVYDGKSKDTVNMYLSTELVPVTKIEWNMNKPGDDIAELNYVRLVDENLNDISFIEIGQKIGIEYEYTIKKSGYQPIPNLHFFTAKGDYVFVIGEEKKPHHGRVGTHRTVAWIPEHLLNTQTYVVNVALSNMIPLIVHFNVEECLVFDVVEDINKRPNEYVNEWPGFVRPKVEWESYHVK